MIRSAQSPALASRLGAVGVFPRLITKRATMAPLRVVGDGDGAGNFSSPSKTRVPRAGSLFLISSPGSVSSFSAGAGPARWATRVTATTASKARTATPPRRSDRVRPWSGRVWREGSWIDRERLVGGLLRPARRWHPDDGDAPSPVRVGRDPGEGQHTAHEQGHASGGAHPYNHSPTRRVIGRLRVCVLLAGRRP